MNKKGTIPSALVDFVGYGAFIVVLLVFFFLFKLSEGAKINELKAMDFAEVSGQQFLLNYLRTPVYISGMETMTMADYIVMQYEKEAKTELEEKFTQDFIKYMREFDLECYALKLEDENGNYIWINSPTKYPTACFSPSNAIILPTHTRKNLLIGLGVTLINE